MKNHSEDKGIVVSAMGNNCTDKNIRWRNWVAVFMLGLASFIVVSTELAPIGMLSSIAKDMGQDASTTGLVVTLYAWLGAAAALLSVLTISHLPRRPLLVALMLMLGVSNGVSAASDSFEVLLTARLVGALAHGAFWAMIGTMAVQLVSPQHVGKATAIIFGGVSAASVLGVPLINWISSGADWRLSFSWLGILSVITGFTLAVSLPYLSGASRLNRNQFSFVFRSPKLKLVYLITAFSIVAHFSAFTFVEVLLSSELTFSNNWISICLLAFGVAGILGNFVCGIFLDNHLERVLGIGLLLITSCLMLISVYPVKSETVVLLLMVGWGIGGAILFVGLQAWVIRLAGDNVLPASAIYACIFNSAIGVGAVFGAGILEHWSIDMMYLTTSIILLLSFALVTISSRRNKSEEQAVV